MGALIYKKSFDLELSHTFYSVANEQFLMINDIDFAPTRTTAEILANNRMRWAKTGKGLSVFYKAQATDAAETTTVPMAQLSGSPEFLFTFSFSQNFNRFMNITELSIGGTYNPVKKLMLSGTHNTTGSAATVTLTASLIDFVSRNAFTYEFRRATGTGNVDVKVYNESNVLKQTVAGISADTLNVFRAAVDLTKEAAGLYTIKVFDAGTSTEIQSVKTYVDNDLATQNFFGFIRMKYTTAAELYSNADKFSYAFAPRSVKWRYIVVIKEDSGNFFATVGNTLSIDSTGTGITFAATGTQPHATYKVNDFKTVVFTSSAAVAFSSNPRTFKLMQNGEGAKELMKFMPNATYDNPDSDRLADGLGPYAEIFVFVESIKKT